jgi:aromatic ring-opening dioxygenase catalytic subunit (LigB family)
MFFYYWTVRAPAQTPHAPMAGGGLERAPAGRPLLDAHADFLSTDRRSGAVAMGDIVVALASSHAFAVLPPERWDEVRERNRKSYARRYGSEPPVHPRVEEESWDLVQPRYERVRSGLAALRQALVETQPDALIVIGDDQNENFSGQNCPQLAIYTAGEAVLVDRSMQESRSYPCDGESARTLLEGAVEAGFDVAICDGFPENRLLSHAHVEPLMRVLLPAADIPIVPIFVNAIHWPAATPARCFAFGEALADIVRTRLGKKRIAIYASGGLSHFTAGYPWRVYRGPFAYGAISEAFDRKLIRWMTEGRAEEIKKLTSDDLLDHGNIEFRCWIVALGMVGAVPAQMLAYEPLYRGLMGMGVARWTLPAARGA